MPRESIYSFAALQNRLVVTGQLVAITAFRIGAGRATNVIGNDLPVLRDGLGAPFIPGASLKGAFRARLEALIRAVAPDQARDLLEIEEHMRGPIAELVDSNEIQQLQRSQKIAAADRGLSDRVWKQSTLIDLTFGAPWIAGRLFFKDAFIDRSLWFDQFEIRNGIGINRDTETVQQGLLYDYEVVPAGMRFEFKLMLENAADWQLGMVLLALQPWERGEVQIGGFRSRGLGYIQLVDAKRRFVEVREHNADDVLRMLGYDHNDATDIVDEARATEWFVAFREALRNPQQVIEQGGADA